jgi:sigma-E factor negative regulatory protein RseB
VIRRIAPGWRAASLAAMIGLLGSGIAALVVSDASTGQASVAGESLIDGAPRPARAPQTAPGSAGLALLQQAAVACQDTPYRGVQAVLWLGQGDPATSLMDVWHHPGQVTVVRPDGDGQAAGAGYPDLDGIVGISPPLLALLAANYQVSYAGRGSSEGHQALIVEVRRPDGELAARFWIDAATKLPLRRELYAGDAQLISEDAFTHLVLGDRGLGVMPSAAASAANQLDQGSLAALRAQGWPLPAQLPGNLSLFAATMTSASPGQVVGLSYSDGLSVVSVFVQRGLLAGPMPGWRPVALAGRTVYAVDPDDQGDRSLAWSAGGFVYTVFADAPAGTVRQVVVALPDGSQPGFWSRMAHGLHRMASWANPLRH